MWLFLQDLQEFLRISCAARQDSCKISCSCRKHYRLESCAILSSLFQKRFYRYKDLGWNHHLLFYEKTDNMHIDA